MKIRKVLTLVALNCVLFGVFGFSSCNDDNKTAREEQAHIENNQAELNRQQPSPTITWSLERDNLIKRFKLQNDRTVSFYMYVFVEGVGQPVGYYQVTKVSSVNSQLTATQQMVRPAAEAGWEATQVLESPAEDGSYGSNGNGVFGFTPEDVYIETNMHYITSTIPLTFAQPVTRLAVVNTDEARKLLETSQAAMKR
jgi:hypothetical protein